MDWRFGGFGSDAFARRNFSENDRTHDVSCHASWPVRDRDCSDANHERKKWSEGSVFPDATVQGRVVVYGAADSSTASANCSIQFEDSCLSDLCAERISYRCLVWRDRGVSGRDRLDGLRLSGDVLGAPF